MRDIIDKNEGKLTIIRIIGFCLMLTGIVTLICCSFYTGGTIPHRIAIAFFITMLGFSLSFPSLLEGNEGLSTMRIVVFMVTNVICMLLLKIGWADGIGSMEDIKIDQYWVGIIAFVFGAKAVQHFFESKLADPKGPEIFERNEKAGKIEENGRRALEFTSAQMAKLAVVQNEQYMKVKWPNILTISDTLANNSKVAKHIVAIYLKDDDKGDIPSQLEVRMQDNSVKLVETEIIKRTGKARIQYSQLNSSVARQDNTTYRGSICCGVESTIEGRKFKGVVTSAHIYSKGRFDDKYNGMLNASQQTPILINDDIAGKWYYKIMDYSQDLAIAVLDDDVTDDPNYFKFHNRFHQVTDADVATTESNITMLSKDNKTKTAYIIDYNVGFPVYYDNGPFYKKNLILIGSTNDRETAMPISDDGDSGSCIYHTKTKKLIGMLLGRNEKFSLVLPLEEALKIFNLKTI